MRQAGNATKREAAQFLCGDVDACPVIRAIDDLEQLADWIEVARTLRIEGRQRRMLRQRCQALRSRNADVGFRPASEIATRNAAAESDAANADGGTVVEEGDDSASGSVAGSTFADVDDALRDGPEGGA